MDVIDITQLDFIMNVIIYPTNSYFKMINNIQKINAKHITKTRYILSANYIQDIIKTIMIYGPDPVLTDAVLRKSRDLKNWNEKGKYKCFAEFFFSTYHLFLNEKL